MHDISARLHGQRLPDLHGDPPVAQAVRPQMRLKACSQYEAVCKRLCKDRQSAALPDSVPFMFSDLVSAEYGPYTVNADRSHVELHNVFHVVGI